MEKTKVKKHLHLNPVEKKHVAKMIETGATLAEVDKWYQIRFEDPIRLANRKLNDVKFTDLC